ncbi:wall-associated receptor kinase-like 8 isoform X2 [Salvia splendens]|uniref:wall-associated receptor kinase-like 8 isoform X2 n=1 Tax=Salvia splendens TaxID=180675 RepID=UPI001C27E2E6|nr:wall-associated receptor kinase-like 8 isoform X2 [Salvia splendens]
MISLLHLIIFFLVALDPLASSPSPTHKPGCPARCGNMMIPYPFGVGSGCSLGSSFNITCNTSTTPPKPYLNISGVNLEVVEIGSDDPTRIRIWYPYLLYGVCYDLTSGNVTWEDGSYIDLSETQYTLSENNWQTTIGCDDFGTASTYRGREEYRDACVGYCSISANRSNVGVCPNNGYSNSVGEGCCRVPIAKGTQLLGVGLLDLTKILNRTRLFPCSYAFVKEKGSINEPAYSYNLSILQQRSGAFFEKNEALQVVRLDWRIGDQNCSQAHRNSTYACQANSHCVDFGAEIGGYLCNCSKGYIGNPYLYQGCTDINECDDNPCAPHAKCKNIHGSFSCSCDSGYNGDGKKGGSGCTSSMKFVLIGQGTFGKTKLFNAKELEKATDHFNKSRICGRGGQGIVYKGMLSDGTIVAIKKLNKVDENQLEQFINEVVILSQINHKNVVRLLGCCLATQDPLLVYEFLPNGTLFDSIHDPKPEFPLTWNMRLKIATDVAGALAYLHFASSVPIYHRDIKSTNILLDEKYVVKVSDFGISKLVEVDQTHLTTVVKGTFGYLDPEYYQTSQYTEKSDVYSFGVVLLELLTGQRPISMERTEVGRNLASHFLAYIGADNLDAILDARVLEEGGKDEVIAVARLARRCLNVRGQMRPTMKEVATELESLVMSQIHPANDMELEEEAIVSEAKDMEFSDIEYSWTSNVHGVATSSSDAHPLMSND